MDPVPRYRAGWRASFGPFTLSPAERLLAREGVPVRLGGRALDLLIALVEAAGETLGKKELLARVWPDVVVEEGSLRFHIVAIRKALGDGEGGRRYIVNTASKGYAFVGVVERREAESPPAASAAVPAPAVTRSLPAPATAMVGRDEALRLLLADLPRRRLVSIVGPGGIGKSTLAIATAQAAVAQFDGDVHFVDLSAVSAPALVRAAVAGVVGLQHRLDELGALVAHLAERRALVVLDCCEHVVAAAAELAEALLRGCPQVHLLATSREPLRAEGEFVHRLQPLAFPPEGEGTTAASALAYPAVRLFVDRVAASGAGFELSDAEAPLASQLCRELEGIALAIELAAGRIEALGLKAVTSHFDASVRLLWHGRRTALPRHQTLGATLDWSFGLLTGDEQRLVCRLSVFAGSFTLGAALEVCAFDQAPYEAAELIASLVSKSLVSVDAGEATLRYGMLDTTKAYCRHRLRASGDEPALAQRFAACFGAWVQRYGARTLDEGELDAVRLELPNLRAALDWHFGDDRAGPRGRPADAVGLAASLCPLLLQLSRVAECSRWARAALAQLPPELAGSRVELVLQGALGQSLMYSVGGGGGEAAEAFRRSIEIAEQLGDPRSMLHLLNGCVVLQHREGRYSEALETARRAEALLAVLDDTESRAIVDSLLGIALHFVGRVHEALQHWERCFAYASGASPDMRSKLGFDYQIRAQCGLARCLWLTGHYARAVAVAEETMAKARGYGHAVTHCIALLWAGSVFTYGGDVERLEAMVEELERTARRHSLVPYLNVASITRGQMLITRGRPADGVERIRRAVEVLHECRYEMVTSVSLTFMARGLSDLSLHAAALAMCDEVKVMIERGGDFLRMPELLITQSRCLAAAGRRDEAAQSCLAAIELARSQGVKSAQVRAALALGRLWLEDGRHDESRRLLESQLRDAGAETSSDLRQARALLAGLTGAHKG